MFTAFSTIIPTNSCGEDTITIPSNGTDCGKQIKVFGESNIDEIAAEYDVPVLAKLPMDPALAAACDAGKIEYVENNYMKDAIEVLKKL